MTRDAFPSFGDARLWLDVNGVRKQDSSTNDLIFDVAILGVATAGLLLYLRLVIHEALLAEGAEHEIGPDAPCPECHRIVPTMAFCPACGAARAAASKQGRPRLVGGA